MADDVTDLPPEVASAETEDSPEDINLKEQAENTPERGEEKDVKMEEQSNGIQTEQGSEQTESEENKSEQVDENVNTLPTVENLDEDITTSPPENSPADTVQTDENKAQELPEVEEQEADDQRIENCESGTNDDVLNKASQPDHNSSCGESEAPPSNTEMNLQSDDTNVPTDSNGNSKMTDSVESPSMDTVSSDQSISDVTNSPSQERDTKKIDDENDLLAELDSELSSNSRDKTQVQAVNGLQMNFSIEHHPDYLALKKRFEILQSSYTGKELELSVLKAHCSSQSELLEKAVEEARMLKDKLEATHKDDTQKNDAQQKRFREMDALIKKLSVEVSESRDKLQSHDTAAKKAIAALKNELQVRVAEVTKQYEECKRDKEGMVMKYAMAEQKNIKVTEDMAKVEARMKEMLRERELMIKKYHHTKTEKIKMDDDFQAKNSEMHGLRKELEKQKELLSSSVTKSKWAENKFKAEQDAHKETKAKLDVIQRQLTEAREEAEQVRKDCQAMVRTYQESEEMRSSSLEEELKQKKQALDTTRQEAGDQVEVHKMMRGQLDNLKRKHKEIIDELMTYRDKCKSLDMERQHQDTSLQKYQETLQKQKNEIKALQETLRSLETAGIELKKEQRVVAELKARVSELEEAGKEAAADVAGCSARETQHLSLQQTLTHQNATLTAQLAALQAQVSTDLADYKRLKETAKDMEMELVELRGDLHTERHSRKAEVDALNEQIKEKTHRISELEQEVEDGKDEIKTLKRKHTNNVKDISRQLLHAKKRLEELSGGRGSAERDAGSMGGSMGSRTSSSASLDNPQANSHNGRPQEHAQSPPPQEEEEPIVQVVEIDKQMLMEKIVRLQKSHARKNEKMEFMEDHNKQLLQEVRKKTRIIQNYAMRDEAGALAPPSMDYNKRATVRSSLKAQLAQKGPGIMAAMYSQHSKDGGAMTLELSLEINHKLQALLEDTLLKNITLKENLDTLGAEIARLSQENRQIQLSMQKHSGAKS